MDDSTVRQKHRKTASAPRPDPSEPEAPSLFEGDASIHILTHRLCDWIVADASTVTKRWWRGSVGRFVKRSLAWCKYFHRVILHYLPPSPPTTQRVSTIFVSFLPSFPPVTKLSPSGGSEGGRLFLICQWGPEINITNLQGFETAPRDSLEAAHPLPIVCLTRGARPGRASRPQRSANQYPCTVRVCVRACVCVGGVGQAKRCARKTV